MTLKRYEHTRLKERFGNGRAQAADHAMIFKRYYSAFTLGFTNHKLTIKRLYAKHVDNLARHTLLFQLIRRAHSVFKELTCANNKSVSTFANNVALAHFKRGVVAVNLIRGFSARAHVVDAVHLRKLTDNPGKLHGISSIAHNSAGQRAHDSNVFPGSVRTAVCAHGKARVGAPNINRVVRVTTRQKYLVKGAARSKRAKGMAKRNKPL